MCIAGASQGLSPVELLGLFWMAKIQEQINASDSRFRNTDSKSTQNTIR